MSVGTPGERTAALDTIGERTEGPPLTLCLGGEPSLVSIGGTAPGDLVPNVPSNGGSQRLCWASNAAERAFDSSGGEPVTGMLSLTLGSDSNQFPDAGEFSP